MTIEELQHENALLMDALRPFARFSRTRDAIRHAEGRGLFPDDQHEHVVTDGVVVAVVRSGDFRRAARVCDILST